MDHPITLRVIMERSRLLGKTLYCFFVDFRKTFNIVPRSEFWNRILEIGMSLEYQVAIVCHMSKIDANLNSRMVSQNTF